MFYLRASSEGWIAGLLSIVDEGRRSALATKLDTSGENILEPSWRGTQATDGGEWWVKVAGALRMVNTTTSSGVPMIISEPFVLHLLNDWG